MDEFSSAVYSLTKNGYTKSRQYWLCCCLVRLVRLFARRFAATRQIYPW
jgi:hypothetical protein